MCGSVLVLLRLTARIHFITLNISKNLELVRPDSESNRHVVYDCISYITPLVSVKAQPPRSSIPAFQPHILHVSA